MAAFVILFMFVVGVGLGGWAVAYYLQVVSPERARSFLAHMEAFRIAEDIAGAGKAARDAMQQAASDDPTPEG